MDGCGCTDFAGIFDRATAERDLDRYRRWGPDRTTRMLLGLITRRRVDGATVLDIGGGIGAIDRELLRAGAARAVLVDASGAYVEVARASSGVEGLADRLEIRHGDFVTLAGSVAEADVVTLDRVVCCYPDPQSLVGLSARRARRLYGLVLPRDRRLFRAGLPLLNAWFRLRGSAYRAFLHPNARIDALTSAAGLRVVAEDRTFVWRVVLYERLARTG